MEPQKIEKPLKPQPNQEERDPPLRRKGPYKFDNCNGTLDPRFQAILEIYAMDPERWDGLQ